MEEKEINSDVYGGTIAPPMKVVKDDEVNENIPQPPSKGDAAAPTEIPSAEKPVRREMTFGEGINFNIIYRVKGKKNLFMPLSAEPQKSGMIGMIEVGVDNAISVHKRDLECLGHLEFHTVSNGVLKMGNVFDNLEKFTLEELGKKNDKELMEIMVPEYHPDLFKSYHGEKVMLWYFEIKEKIKIGLQNKQQ